MGAALPLQVSGWSGRHPLVVADHEDSSAGSITNRSRLTLTVASRKAWPAHCRRAMCPCPLNSRLRRDLIDL